MRKFINLLFKNSRWLRCAFLIFLAGNLLGFLLMKVVPDSTQFVFQEPESLSLEKTSVLEKVMALYFWNLRAVLLCLFGGIFFGFIPFFSLFNIGWELGKLFSFCFSYQIVGFFVLGIFPHGVIELPAVIIANAWGLKLGLGWIKQPKGKKRKFIWSTLKEGVYISLGVALLLLIAAIIEGTLTPFLLSFY